MSSLGFTNNGKYFISYAVKSKLPFGLKKVNIKSLENLNRGYKSESISYATRKKIMLRCRVLNYASQIKVIRDTHGNLINHRLSFVTLTLPSTQIHLDTEITKLILGKFLDRCRKTNILQNYVWKAEKQLNGNIHYHLITDSYVNKSIVYRYWLLSLESLGYVSAYKEKFSKMDLLMYKQQKFNSNVSDSVINKRFWKGNKNNWSNPPCFDTSNVMDSKSLENYIAKYISKDENDSNLRVTGRVWGCSSGVNEGVHYFKNDKDFNEFGFQMSKYVLKRKSVIGEFFEIVKCTITSFIAWFPKETDLVFQRLREFIVPCDFHLRGQGVLFAH